MDDIGDVKDLDSPKKLKAAMLEALLDELEKLPMKLIREDNEYTVDSLAEARKWESLKTLAYPIKSSYAHASNRGTPYGAYHLKKFVEVVRYGARDSVRVIGYERASTRSKKAAGGRHYLQRAVQAAAARPERLRLPPDPDDQVQARAQGQAVEPRRPLPAAPSRAVAGGGLHGGEE